MVDSTDKLVVAILAAAKAAADKKEQPGQYIVEYERMLRVFERRAQSASAKAAAEPASTLPSS